MLDSVTGGAKLGSPTTVTVTIETSDDPGGLFGFVNASQLSLQNPSFSTDISLVIEREGGAEGAVEVCKFITVLPRFALPVQVDVRRFRLVVVLSSLLWRTLNWLFATRVFGHPTRLSTVH